MDFKDVALKTAESVAIAPRQQSDVAKVSKEIEAAVIMANRFPRDELQSYQKIMNSLTRPSLAEKAIYSFPRGNQRVEGPSIRMAETMARCWKNLQFGVREIQRLGGASLVEAYCWDLESNIRATKEFTVAHIRDTKKGPVHLNNERDIYEMVANQGARRVRACILACIPDDIVEDAVNKVNEVLLKATKGQGKDFGETIRNMVEKFKEMDITLEQIEKHVGNKVQACSPQQIVKLGKIYNSIKEGISAAKDWFEMPSLTSLVIDKERSKEMDQLEDKLAEVCAKAKAAGVDQAFANKIIEGIIANNPSSIGKAIEIMWESVVEKQKEATKQIQEHAAKG